MAAIEDLIKNIADPRLRETLGIEVARLKASKRFGMVFEEHRPEIVRLPGMPAKAGTRVLKKSDPTNTPYRVIAEVNGKMVRIVPDSEIRNGIIYGLPDSVVAMSEKVERSGLVVTKSFGEPMYPALVPVDSIERDPQKPWHALINADNYHALQLLLYGYEGKVDCIYIDPPYNTGARDWKYNNDYVDKTDRFRHSKWLSMMKKRLLLAGRLLREDGVLICTIDDHELSHLTCLIEDLFRDRKLFNVIIQQNKRGRQGEEFAKTHEYALFACPSHGNFIEQRQLDSTVGGETRNLRRTGNGSLRALRPKQFYPIYVNPESLEIVEVGEPLPAGKSRDDVPARLNAVPVWPVDKLGIERRWYYGPDRTREGIESGNIFSAKQDYGIQVYYTLREKDTATWKTVWSKPSLDASTYGSELLLSLLGRPSGFSYPKSVYAVIDCLLTIIGSKKDAIILDFFAGSGTTLHATAMINESDGGSRRCILVTNNEVGEDVAKRLEQEGYVQGDEEFERNGIAENVTWPRIKAALSGIRPDGTPIPGKYLNDRLMSEGFKENAACFRLDFLDPGEVNRGEKFESVLPILWMVANCHGPCALAGAAGKWHIPEACHFAVLIKEDCFSAFLKKLEDRPDITHVFVVTDSSEAFNEMAGGIGSKYTCIQLYSSYIETFRINLDEAADRLSVNGEFSPLSPEVRA